MAEEKASAVLLAVSELLGREVALEDLRRRLAERIALAMDADRGTLYLVDHGKGEVFSKIPNPELPEIRLRLGQGIAGHVAATGEVVNVPTTTTDERFYRGVDEKTGYRTESILAAPLRDRGGAIIGVIQLLNKRGGPFTRDDEEALAALAAQAAAAIEATTLHAELVRAPSADAGPVPLADRFNKIVGESEPMRRAYHLTAKAAASDATVLVRGESGTGKELIARAVHVNSRRRDGPFVKVDCAALPETLIENELFGHERGAYTGADQKATGKFDAANGGTIFLDELGELPAAVQGKLLRVLQDREFDRVGGSRPVSVNVRVVAATNRDLARMVEEGRFRADLYYRVKVVEIVLPPVRERGPEDVGRLVRHFVAAAARRHGREAPRIAASAMARLTSYPWPGNVRELENCIESAVVIMEGRELLAEHLPLPERVPRLEPAPPPPGPRPRPRTADVPVASLASLDGDDRVLTLEEAEKAHVLAVLERVGGNRSEAARLLGIGRNTLQRKLRGYGISGP